MEMIMQTKFKVGDKVRCIECLPSQYIKLGEVYTVKNITGLGSSNNSKRAAK